MTKYYFIQSVIQYDGLEFYCSNVLKRSSKMTNEQAEKEAKDWHGHDGEYEEISISRFEEITKEEFNIMRKYL